jgi:hypothetical protein
MKNIINRITKELQYLSLTKRKPKELYIGENTKLGFEVLGKNQGCRR